MTSISAVVFIRCCVTEILVRFICLCVAWMMFCATVRAQEHLVLFDTSAQGVTKAITNWGLDVTWPSSANMRRGLMFMGTNEVDMVRVAFLVNAPLTNGEFTASVKANLNTMAAIANMAGANKPWTLSPGTEAGVDPWFKVGNSVIPSRWVQAMDAAARHYKRVFVSTEPFNEPDFSWGQGTMQDLYAILGLLQSSTNFVGTRLAGPSVLNCDNAASWYNSIKSRTTEGTTHALGGSFNSYVNFFQNVIASGDVPVNPEAHNLVEVITGAEYGLEGAIWWGTAELARGSFVKANQGQRLGYAEDRGRWTAAAVYRAPGGAVEAFLGGSERMGQTTTYRFVSRDRSVFFNGDGPRRVFTVAIPGDQEKFVRISWGEDVQPLIGGRYVLVNRHSGKVMEVAGANLSDGANIRQNTYMGGLHQQWDVASSAFVYGDQSFYSIKPAHSGKAADVNNFSHDNGGNVHQWNSSGNEVQQWFFEHAGDGWFYIRSRWSGLCLDVSNGSTANGANIHQWTVLNGLNQQWRLLPVGAAIEFVPPPAITGLRAVARAHSVQLDWEPSVAADFASYTVLRASVSGGPYEIVARGLTNNAFTDNSANQDREYHFVVKAVDRSLNASGRSSEVSATPTLKPAVIAHYAFNGNAMDMSDNANHGSAEGSPGSGSGAHDSALDFDGADDHVVLPAGLLASVTNFTIAAWVNWDGGPAWQRIFDFGNGTTEYMFLTPSSSSGTLRFAVTTNGFGGEQVLQASALPLGQWRHVAVTRAGAQAWLYTNGVLAAIGPMTISPAQFNPVLNLVGDSQFASDPFFNGRIDELVICNFAMTQSEIVRLMSNRFPPPSEPVKMLAEAASDRLRLSWPETYLGTRLESNTVTPASFSNWFPVPGSDGTNHFEIPLDLSRTNVFFRLVYP